MKKRILSALLALAMTFSLLPAAAMAADAEKFTDLSKDAWYYSYVKDVVKDGYMVGTSETTFSPDMDLTRAMFVVIIAAIEEVKVDNTQETKFSDVPANTWYTGAVNWAVKAGVTAGTGTDKFEPDRAITRQEMATMINAYIKWNDSVKKVDLKANGFADKADIADWAADSVEAVRQYGLIAGVPGIVDGAEVRYFLPQKTASRAEIATVVSNLAFFVGGGGSLTYYIVNYYNGDELIESYEVRKNKVHEIIACPEEIIPEGCEFIGWATASDAEPEYQAGDELKVTGNTNLYAIIVEGEEDATDYIYNAMSNVVATVKAEIEEQLKTDIKDTNADGQYTAGGDNSFVQVTGLQLSKDIDENGARPQIVTATVNVESATVEALIKTAVDYAMDILNDLMGASDKKEEAVEMAGDIAETVIDKFETETGVAVTKENAKKIVEAVKAKVKASPNYVRNLWADNFMVDGEYITGDITISSEYGAEAVISVNAENGTYFEGSKKDAIVDMAVAIAKDLYADVKACTGKYYALNEITLDATINVEFSAGAYAEDTNEFPYSYPVTVSMGLDGSAFNNVKYMFKDGHYVQVVVSENVQAEYTAFANQLINDIITPVIKSEMNKALSGFMGTSSSTYAITFAPAIDTDAMMDAAISAWLDKNLTTGDIANSALLDYMNGNTDAELDNEMIYEMIDSTLENTITDTLGDTINPGGALAVEMAKDPEKLKETLQTAAPEAFEKLDNMGLTDYAVAKTQDYLDPSKAEEGTSYADEKREEMQVTVDKVVTSTIDKVVAPSTSTTPSTPADPDAPEIDVPEIDIPVAVPDVSAYVKLLNQVTKLTSIESMADIRLSNLATALRNETVQGYIGTKGDAIVARATSLISKLPAKASIVIDDLVISEATLDAVRQADSTIEACEAIADLIDVIGDMSVSSFADGEDILVKYGEKTWLANLMIVIE